MSAGLTSGEVAVERTSLPSMIIGSVWPSSDRSQKFPRPFPHVRVRRDFRRGPEPIEDFLARRPLLVLREDLVDLADPLLEAVHPEDELFALGQELRVFLARHGETRPPRPFGSFKTSQPSKEAAGSSRWMT